MLKLKFHDIHYSPRVNTKEIHVSSTGTQRYDRRIPFSRSNDSMKKQGVENEQRKESARANSAFDKWRGTRF